MMVNAISGARSGANDVTRLDNFNVYCQWTLDPEGSMLETFSTVLN